MCKYTCDICKNIGSEYNIQLYTMMFSTEGGAGGGGGVGHSYIKKTRKTGILVIYFRGYAILVPLMADKN